MGSYFRISVVLCVVLFSGCAQLNPAFWRGSELDRATAYYENGLIFDAMAKAKSIPRSDQDYKAARKLIEDINAISMQLSRRHMEIGEDFEKAAIYGPALAEYRESLKYNPSNILARNKIETIGEAMRSGEKSDRNKVAKKAAKEEPEELANTHYLKGKIYLDSKTYAKAIEEFSAVLKILPSYMNTAELLARAKRERDKAVDVHLRKGIAYFQSEEMEMAIKEWEAVLELDPSNKIAADYKDRAEVIMERLKRIREKQAFSGEAPVCLACSIPPALN
ncbi:MAG: hypothetical protein IT362_09965 [Deltaproteobacteria bacterium]|nr:hypothetical protein [Deltaproteobacteria bacterium]